MLVRMNHVMDATHHLWMGDVSAIVRLVKRASTATPTSMNVKKVRTIIFCGHFGNLSSTKFITVKWEMKKCIFLESQEEESFLWKTFKILPCTTPNNIFQFQVFARLVNTSALVSTHRDLSDATVSKDSRESDVNKT